MACFIGSGSVAFDLGHNIATRTIDFGGYQAIKWDDDQRVYYGASESRKDGQAAGY